jgi:type IV pilus assembly protein PilZ
MADDVPDNEDRRRVKRMVVDLQVDFSADDMFLYSYITDLSPLGIFLRSNAPFEVGTRLTMRFTPPGEEEVVELEGEVRWISPFRFGALEAREPGMGVQFIDPPERLREQLMGLVGGAVELRKGDGQAPT